MPVSKERNLCQRGGKEMVYFWSISGSISGAAPHEDTSQQELCFLFLSPLKE